jgi:hypothetical protein
MDLNKAIQYAQLVNAAYDVEPTNLASSAGNVVTAGGTAYTVVTTIYATDLATDVNPSRSSNQVSIGLILQAVGAGDVVIAVRGTEGIKEWITDAEFLQVTCPFLVGAGKTEDGFTDMYSSMRIDPAVGSPSVVSALAKLPYKQPVTSMTICGHSLGGALVTLMGLDVAANTIFKNPTVYSYASPRTGDPDFASTYDQVVPNTFRVANRMDLVPKLPFPPMYEHVTTLFELNPVRLLPLPPQLVVKPTIECQHFVDTYLHLLSVAAGGPVLALDQNCAP